MLDQERTASGEFLQDLLGSAAKDGPDRAFLIQFAHDTELLQDLTDSKPKLQAALKEIDSQTQGSQAPDPDDNSGGHRGGHQGGGTVLYDAVFLSGDELMARQHGRKALIILSDGDDRGSKKSLARSIEAAQRSDTIIYAIYFKGESHGGFGGYPGGGGGGHHGGGGGYPGGSGSGGNQGGGGYPGGGGRGESVDGKKVLERMADETGGRLFEVKGKQTVAAIYAQIAEELRAQYRLGYTPDAATAAEGYHQVALALPAQKKFVVQTRDGYYTGAN